MNKDILRAIMKRTRLCNKFLKVRTIENKIAYNKQRNLCVSLVKMAKKDYFENLDVKKVTNNKIFWKNVSPCFTDKTKVKENLL